MRTETIHTCAVCGGASIATLDSANNIQRCETCQFVFDSPRPTVDELIKFYSRAEQYDGWLSLHDEREKLWRRRLAKVLKVDTPRIALLDVGAGIGQFLHMAEEHFEFVTGTEVSASAVAHARVQYSLELISGQVEDLDLDRKFSHITMFHVLEHVPDPSLTIAKCKKLLEPGGHLFIAVPNELGALRPHVAATLGKMGVRRFRGRRPVDIPRIVLDGSLEEIHLSHFSVRSLRHLLERHDLEIVEFGLDPYAVAHDLQTRIKDCGLRVFGELVMRTTGRNVYDATWVVARKRHALQG